MLVGLKRLNMEGGCEEKVTLEQGINVEKYRRLVKSYIDLVSITWCQLQCATM